MLSLLLATSAVSFNRDILSFTNIYPRNKTTNTLERNLSLKQIFMMFSQVLFGFLMLTLTNGSNMVCRKLSNEVKTPIQSQCVNQTVLMKGPAGEKGMKGRNGEQGAAGKNGSVGEKGEVGEINTTVLEIMESKMKSEWID